MRRRLATAALGTLVSAGALTGPGWPSAQAQTAPGVCDQTTYRSAVHRVGQPAGARSAFDGRNGVHFVVSPSVQGRLSDVRYPTAAGAVTVDGVALPARSSAGEGYVHRVAGVVAWRAVRSTGGELYLEILSSDPSSKPSQVVAQAVNGCPAGTKTFVVDTGVSGRTPVEVCPGVTGSGGRLGFSAVLAQATTELAQATTEPACGIQLDGRIVGTYADGVALVDRWQAQLSAMRAAIRSVAERDPSLGAFVDPIVDLTMSEGFPLRNRMAPRGAARLTDDDESAVFTWFERAVNSYNAMGYEHDRVVTLQARRAAERVGLKVAAFHAANLAAAREKQRLAFCAEIRLCEEQADGSLAEGVTGELAEMAAPLEELQGYVGNVEEFVEKVQKEVAKMKGAGFDPYEDLFTHETFDRLDEVLAVLGQAKSFVESMQKAYDKLDYAGRLAALLRAPAAEYGEISRGLDALAVALGTLEQVPALEELLKFVNVVVPGLAHVDEIVEATQTILRRERERWVAGINKLRFEQGDWRSVRWELEPGGRPAAEYVLTVVRARSASTLTMPPQAVADFFARWHAEISEGAGAIDDWTERSGVSGRRVKADFPSWVWLHRHDVWGMLYGSRLAPARVRN